MTPTGGFSARPRVGEQTRGTGSLGRGLIALVADDNLVNQKVVQKLLERRGYQSVVVENGAMALDALKEQSFDFVLMDIQMPVMDGVKATIAIREKERGTDQHIPIIAVTAHAMKGDREKYLDAGVDDYVSKPIDPRLLYQAIDNLTGGEGAGDMETLSNPEQIFDADGTMDRFDGDVEFLQEVAQQFSSDAVELLTAIQSAIDAADGVAVSRAAHTLKGAASNFGAASLIEAARRVEELGPKEGIDAAKPYAEKLPALVAKLEKAVEDFCASLQS